MLETLFTFSHSLIHSLAMESMACACPQRSWAGNALGGLASSCMVSKAESHKCLALGAHWKNILCRAPPCFASSPQTLLEASMPALSQHRLSCQTIDSILGPAWFTILCPALSSVCCGCCGLALPFAMAKRTPASFFAFASTLCQCRPLPHFAPHNCN